MGYLLELDSEPGTYFESVEGSFLKLACFDAFKNEAVTSLCSDRPDKVGGQRQKVYRDTFASFHPKELDRIVVTIRMFTQLWYPT